MTRQELIERLVELNDIDTKAAAARILDHLQEVVVEQLTSGSSVALGNNFGTFVPKTNAARSGRNPQTGEPLEIPESKSVKFKPSAALKRTLNS